MKTISKVLCALVLAAGFVACTDPDRNPEFTSYTFVTFVGSGYSVAEDTVQFDIPVMVYPKPNGDITVTLAIVDDESKTATLGTDFTLENDVLSFTAADTVNTKAMTVKVVNHTGVFTNTLGFNVEIKEIVGDAVVVGTNNLVSVIIKDLDHPLSAILGEYDLDGLFYNSGLYLLQPNASAIGLKPVAFTTDADDPTIVWISSLCPMYGWYAEGVSKVYGKVADDFSTIKVPYGQILSANYGEGLVPVGLQKLSYDSTNGLDIADFEEGECITFTRDTEAEGTVYKSTDNWDYMDLDEGGNPTYINVPIIGGYHPSYPASLTKK